MQNRVGAAGKYLSHTRYEWYYGDFSQGEFFKNSVAVSDYDEKSWATYPSENQVNILESVNFPVVDRMAETHIFTGLVRVPKCQSGVFKFRVTSDDAAHLLIDGNIRVSNPGVHAMQAVEHLSRSSQAMTTSLRCERALCCVRCSLCSWRMSPGSLYS